MNTLESSLIDIMRAEQDTLKGKEGNCQSIARNIKQTSSTLWFYIVLIADMYSMTSHLTFLANLWCIYSCMIDLIHHYIFKDLKISLQVDKLILLKSLSTSSQYITTIQYLPMLNCLNSVWWLHKISNKFKKTPKTSIFSIYETNNPSISYLTHNLKTS